MAIGEELDGLHKKVYAAMGPFTMMLVRRKYSPSVMKQVVRELEEAVSAMKELVK